MERQDLSGKVGFSKLGYVGFEFGGRSIIFLPVRLASNLSLSSLRLAFLYKVLSADVLLTCCLICNDVDVTEEIANVVRSKRFTLI